MPLTESDVVELIGGFQAAGFHLVSEPQKWKSPLHIRWRLGADEFRFRLWLFDVKHGGGGPGVRAPDEFRIQVSNGPKSKMDEDGYRDILLGFSTSKRVVVAYPRGYLEHFLKQVKAGKRPSPSAQVDLADIDAGKTAGLHFFTKETDLFGDVNHLTMTPEFLPAFLLHADSLLTGSIPASEALAAMPTATTTLDGYAASQRLFFPPRIMARYLAALTAKPFVILAGISGTGKTKLAQVTAEYYARVQRASAPPPSPKAAAQAGDEAIFEGARWEVDRSRTAFVSVRPDWTDGRSLLGYFNPITEKYEPTATLTLLLRAAAATRHKPAQPHFLVLDEMNLARVEHYFSDFLSCLETRKVGPSGELTQESLALHEHDNVVIRAPSADGRSVEELQVPPRLAIPENLYITGTVNVDETTYGFSPKVLDRAQVVEFDDVDLDGYRTGKLGTAAAGEAVPTYPNELPPMELATQERYAKASAALHAHLKTVNEILRPAHLHLGYRSAAEIALFAERLAELYKGQPPPLVQREVVEAVMLQKVLPRVHGNRARLEAPLAEMSKYLATLDPKPLHALERLATMQTTLRDFGFVTFFR